MPFVDMFSLFSLSSMLYHSVYGLILFESALMNTVAGVEMCQSISAEYWKKLHEKANK